MKKNLLALLLIFGTGCIALSQVTVTNETFPQEGDTLRVAIDNLPEGIDISPIGADQTWDFTSLSAPFSQEIIYRPASEGSASEEVPTADIFADVGQDTELYYSVSEDKFELVAGKGPDPAGFGINTLIKFDPGVLQRRAPISDLFEQNFSESNLLVPISTEEIPEELLSNFPLVPDSIRLRLNQERADLVDAWGKLDIPGGSFDVIRERRLETSDARIDILLPILGWQDVTDIVAEFIGPDFDGLGQDTTLTYHYFSNDAKEAIAVVTMDNSQENVESVTYKAIDIIDNLSPIQIVRPGVYAYPNPAINEARFEFTNLNAGNYKLKIFNILGVSIWENNYYVNGTKTEKVDLTNFRKGTYLYSLVDSRGKTLVTKRLMIIRP